MLRLVLLALLLAAGVQTAAAQIGQFPGVAPPVPSPGPSAIPQPPIIYTPNISGRGATPYLMAPVTPGPHSTPLLVPRRPARPPHLHRPAGVLR